jgi:TatD DNase family protein
MLTDTHCHLDFNKFDEDRAAVLQRALDTGLTRILIPGLDWDSSLAAIRLASSHPALFAAVGFHPTDAEKWDESAFGKLKTLLMESGSLLPGIQQPTPGLPKKIVAIGEIGLDYYDAWFGNASMDLIEILSEWQGTLKSQDNPLAEAPGVLHSFNGNLETARKALDLNFFIGVTGPITYKNAEVKRQIIRQLPLEQLLIETDSPFLAPVPMRGKRNEPAFVMYIADKIAEIHMTTREQVERITSNNAARLFGWGG